MKYHVNSKRVIGKRSPMLYGHFIEHFHRQIYDGIYDPGNELSDEEGFRKDIIEAMKKIKVPVLRWPGGCFVSSYHWKDGVGENRQPFFDKAWRVEDPNTFGTDEYIHMCRKIACEPYICTNAGTGTAEEMSDWVEYCNLENEGKYAKWRIANGEEQPYNVKYWSIGNENYGNWEIGAKSSEEWWRLVKESAKMIKHVSPTVELSAAALPDIDWTFQELHVGFWTSMADEWNKQNPDRPINLTVTTGESSSLHSKLLIACQSGEGAPDMADIEIGHYGAFLKDGYLLPINDAVEPYKDDVVMSRISMYGDNEGNYYGVDFHLGATVAYYNMDIMNEAGIDPADIVTWDDYVEAGKTVLEKTGTPMCAVETSDLFFPQCMMLEKGAQYVDEDGNPNLVTDEHAEVIDYIRSMINDGVCEIAPGGGFHTEEWYGHLNGAGVASVIMPLWYMGRFTDYCPDLEGKMAIYPIPVWNEGDTREVLQGGTGTSVIKGTENEQLAKDFLAFAKLSKEGCTYEWEKLGFDPIRTELWDDPAITENKDNKFLAYFTTNPFDILKENGTDITAPNISGSYSATYSTLVSTTYSNAFEISVDQDAKELLQSEQDSIIY